MTKVWVCQCRVSEALGNSIFAGAGLRVGCVCYIVPLNSTACDGSCLVVFWLSALAKVDFEGKKYRFAISYSSSAGQLVISVQTPV